MEDFIMGIFAVAALYFFMKKAEIKRRYGENPPDAKYSKDRK